MLHFNFQDKLIESLVFIIPYDIAIISLSDATRQTLLSGRRAPQNRMRYLQLDTRAFTGEKESAFASLMRACVCLLARSLAHVLARDRDGA